MTTGEFALAILETLQPPGRANPTEWSIWPMLIRVERSVLVHRIEGMTRPSLLGCLQEPETALLLSPDEMSHLVRDAVDRGIASQHEFLLNKRRAIMGGPQDDTVCFESSKGPLDMPFLIVEQLLKTVLLPCPWTLRTNEVKDGPPMRLRIRLSSGDWTT